MSSNARATNSPRILVFDSGVGGLSVAKEIQERLPNVSLVYASDNGFFPYGTKGEAELIVRVEQVISQLLARYPVDILVIACNTASTLTLPHLRSQLDLPIVGVVPAIKPAVKFSTTGVIGLLATPATIARPYTHELIREYAPQCDVISLGSSELVQIAEQKLRGETIDDQALARISAQLMQHEKAAQMDVLVLACTHFPLLKTELAAHLPSKVKLIDSGEAIARRVEHLLKEQLLKEQLSEERLLEANADSINNIEHLAVFTQKTSEAERLIPALNSFNIFHSEFLEIQ